MTESYSTVISPTKSLQPAKADEVWGGAETPWPGTVEIHAGRGTFYLINHIAPVYQGR